MLAEYLENHRGDALGFAIYLTGNLDDAEDLVQEASVKALLNPPSLKKTPDFQPWFFRVMKNTWTNICKNSKTGPWINRYYDPYNPDQKPTIHSLDDMTDAGMPLAAEPPGPSHRRQALYLARLLPGRQRQCCGMLLAGLGYSEIADCLDISESAARDHVSRAKKKFEAVR